MFGAEFMQVYPRIYKGFTIYIVMNLKSPEDLARPGGKYNMVWQLT